MRIAMHSLGSIRLKESERPETRRLLSCGGFSTVCFDTVSVYIRACEYHDEQIIAVQFFGFKVNEELADLTAMCELSTTVS